MRQFLGLGARARGLGFVLALCASAAALLAAPFAASACPSLASVKAFRGEASMAFGGTASSGAKTITLGRTADELKVDLNAKGGGHGLIDFTGKASGGSVAVHDTYKDMSASGQETYNGPASGPAMLTLNTNSCTYQLMVSFGATTTYSGDPAIEPGDQVNGTFVSDPRHIPGSLNLGGAPVLRAYRKPCGGGFGFGPGCYSPGGGWANDF